MKTKMVLALLLGVAAELWGQPMNKIHGLIKDADSNAVAFATVRVPGLTAKQTNANGYFAFDLPRKTAENYFLKPGVDLTIRVEKEGMVMLEPPEQDPTIRLPQNWTYQKPFRIYLTRKGSLALLRSDRMLEAILRQKIQAAVEAKEDELARRDVLAEQAQLLGLDKPALLKAVGEFKDRLRTSADLNMRGLAALDDANEAKEFKLKQQKLDSAEVNFRQAVRKAERAIREGEEEKKRVPEYYYNLGLTFFEKARYDSAAHYFAKADNLAPGEADKLNMLGRALDELAQYDKAMQVYQRALAKDTTTFGRNHPKVAIRLNNIGSVLHEKGDYDGALAKFNEALAISEKSFGREHPDVANRLNNIAFVLNEKGYYEEALAKFNEALAIDERYFGRNHPKVATLLSNIALGLKEKGDYDMALAKYNEALAIDERYFGRNHPKVAIRLNNIAIVLTKKGDYGEALARFNEALVIFENFFGRDHPNVATGLNNIALVLTKKGDYNVALVRYNQALAINERYFGRSHPSVAIGLNNIAGVLLDKGDYEGALTKYNEALVIFENFFGRDHPNVATGLGNIAEVLELKGDYEGALAKSNEALEIDEQYFGHNHPNVATRLNNIAFVLRSKGDYEGALTKYNQAFAIFEKSFGRDHPNVATGLNNIAFVLYSKGDYDVALAKYNEALAVDERYFGHNHPNVATRLNNIALVLKEKGDYERALAKFNEALAIDERYFGRNHLNVATRLNNIANVLESKGDYEGALTKYNEALAIFTKLLGPDHPNTKTVRQNKQEAWWSSLSEKEQLFWRTQYFLGQLSENPADTLKLVLLNQVSVGYLKQAKTDSALIYLQQALPLAQELEEQEMTGTILNNLGSAYKLKQDWPQARQWLEKSLSHNRKAQGDSAAVLAYTYFHLAGVAQAEGQANRSREYAQKSLALAERHKLTELRAEVEAFLKQKR